MTEQSTNIPDFLQRVRDYYSGKIAQHGPVPAGVDWSSIERQEKRFAALTSCVKPGGSFAILDYGCGYGALWDYLHASGRQFEYTGVDVSDEMIQQARALHPAFHDTAFRVGGLPPETFDYVVASGIFNVMCGADETTWEGYVRETLIDMFAISRLACACNFLTSYSDADKKRPNLYYADPKAILDFCIRELSMNVQLLHHYGTWDFTVQVFKAF